MDDVTPPPDPVDEARLIVALRDLVDDEHPSGDLRENVIAGLEAKAPPRPSVPVVPIVAALIVAVVAVATLASHQGGSAGVSTQAPATSIENSAAADAGATTTTSAPSTSSSTTTSTAPVAATAPASTPTTAAAGSVGVSACRNSTTPTCGPFRWDPEPTNQPAALTVSLPPGPIVMNRSYELTLEMTDPDGPVDLACYSVDADKPALALGTCSQEAQPPCPERYGPWTPPGGSAGQATSVTQIEFQRTGTYTLDVRADAAPGCDNVDPYRSPATTRITVEVVDS